jgi:phage terminase large subunit
MNPATREHWIYKRFFEGAGVKEGSNMIKNNVLYIHTTYLDNLDNLSSKFLAKIELIKKRFPKKFKYRILGGWQNKADGVIYENWSIGAFDDDLPFVYGLDFGYSIDPDACVKVAIDKDKNKIYIEQLIYERGQSTRELIEGLKAVIPDKDSLIIADHEPRLVDEIFDAGFNIEKADKQGKASHIKSLQDYELIITESSTDLAKELNLYAWSNKRANIPMDGNDHALDGFLYAATYLLNNSSEGNIDIY